MQDIAQIRRSGFAIDDEEHIKGLRCVGAAIWSADGEAVGAISVSGIAARMTPDKLTQITRQVQIAAADLTRRIGGKPAAAP